MTFYFKTLVILRACLVITMSSPYVLQVWIFCIQLVGAFTFTAITFEIIQYYDAIRY